MAWLSRRGSDHQGLVSHGGRGGDGGRGFGTGGANFAHQRAAYTQGGSLPVQARLRRRRRAWHARQRPRGPRLQVERPQSDLPAGHSPTQVVGLDKRRRVVEETAQAAGACSWVLTCSTRQPLTLHRRAVGVEVAIAGVTAIGLDITGHRHRLVPPARAGVARPSTERRNLCFLWRTRWGRRPPPPLAPPERHSHILCVAMSGLVRVILEGASRRGRRAVGRRPRRTAPGRRTAGRRASRLRARRGSAAPSPRADRRRLASAPPARLQVAASQPSFSSKKRRSAPASARGACELGREHPAEAHPVAAQHVRVERRVGVELLGRRRRAGRSRRARAKRPRVALDQALPSSALPRKW